MLNIINSKFYLLQIKALNRLKIKQLTQDFIELTYKKRSKPILNSSDLKLSSEEFNLSAINTLQNKMVQNQSMYQQKLIKIHFKTQKYFYKFVFVHQKSLNPAFGTVFWYKITFLICVCIMSIYKGCFAVQNWYQMILLEISGIQNLFYSFVTYCMYQGHQY